MQRSWTTRQPSRGLLPLRTHQQHRPVRPLRAAQTDTQAATNSQEQNVSSDLFWTVIILIQTSHSFWFRQSDRHTHTGQPLPSGIQAEQLSVHVRQAGRQLCHHASNHPQAVPPGCSRYSISLKKPLGLVLEQNKDTGVITIAEIAPEGNAAKTGLVAVVSTDQSVLLLLPHLS